VRIRDVVLPTADPEAAAAFHPATYGASRVRFEPGPAVCSHFAVNVAPERFEEAVDWGRTQAELIQEDVPFEMWRARAAYYFDPVGNLVELIARERAPGKQLLIEVSEVGLPVADVAAAVEFLESEFGLPHFSGDRENFSAVGDDRGLFILVPVGRAWLFTDRPATDAPVRVTIEGDAARELVLPGSSHVIEIASE
jgi:catechol-2,3-dioxygenase